MNEKQITQEVEETKKIIDNFAKKNLYSANCIEVKYLYQKLRQLKQQKEAI